jgi:hypothetical protein
VDPGGPKTSGTLVLFTPFFKDKKSKKVTNQKKSRFYRRVLLDDGRIRSRIRTCDQRIWMRIPRRPKNIPDPDPQHWQIEFKMYDVQVDLQQKKWSRREEGNFLRTILAYGVEYNKQDQRYNWDR